MMHEMPNLSKTEKIFRNGFTLPAVGNTRGAALLFHGVTGSPLEMEGLAGALSQAGYHALVPRLSGHTGRVADLRRTRHSEWLMDAERAIAELRQFPPPYFVIGLSFGALLTLHSAVMYPNLFKAAVIYSPPLWLRNPKKELLLSFLKFMPENVLDRLWTVPKPSRAHLFRQPRETLEVHSVGAVARLGKLRRQVLKELSTLEIPVLALFDPNDHHVAERSIEILREHLGSKLTVNTVLGGEHELTIGPHADQIIAQTIEFMEKCRAN
jgi:esterase/lipase